MTVRLSDGPPRSRESAADLIDQLKKKFGNDLSEPSETLGQAVVNIDPAKWPAIASWLAADGGLKMLVDVCGVDRLSRTPRFDVVYQLLDLDKGARLRVIVSVDERIASVTGLWPTANWHEREIFDMFGIVFEGHPDLTRILMPDDWEGHPLRKDYSMGKVPIEYKHLSPGF